MDEFEETVLPDWDSSKSPYFMTSGDPVALMTYGELRPRPRSWSHLRRCALSAPVGYAADADESESPVANWANHYYAPQQWERVKDQHDGDRYVVNLTLPARQNMKTDFREYLVEDDETVVMNPIPLIDLFNDKGKTSDYLDEQEFPGIPSVTGEEVLTYSEDELAHELGTGEEGYVVKPCSAYGGDGVESFDSLDAVEDYLADELGDILDDNGGAAVVQPRIPHTSDVRIITVGDTVVNAERRIAPDGELCTNVSCVDSTVNGMDLGVYGTTHNAYQDGRVMPLKVDVYDEVSDRLRGRNDMFLSPDAEDLALDLLDSFDPDRFEYDDSLPEKPIVMGVDALEVDTDDLAHLPDRYQERATAYAHDGTALLVPELNGNPGSMADLLARWHQMPEQITTLHVSQLMQRLAGDETADEIAANPDNGIVNNRDNGLWRRVDRYYPDHTANLPEQVKRIATV
jgi:hypothetical protein